MTEQIDIIKTLRQSIQDEFLKKQHEGNISRDDILATVKQSFRSITNSNNLSFVESTDSLLMEKLERLGDEININILEILDDELKEGVIPRENEHEDDDSCSESQYRLGRKSFVGSVLSGDTIKSIKSLTDEGFSKQRELENEEMWRMVETLRNKSTLIKEKDQAQVT